MFAKSRFTINRDPKITLDDDGNPVADAVGINLGANPLQRHYVPGEKIDSEDEDHWFAKANSEEGYLEAASRPSAPVADPQAVAWASMDDDARTAVVNDALAMPREAQDALPSTVRLAIKDRHISDLGALLDAAISEGEALKADLDALKASPDAMAARVAELESDLEFYRKVAPAGTKKLEQAKADAQAAAKGAAAGG